MKTTMILPDIQYPYHDKLMLSKIFKIITELQPDNILSIGDAIDFPQVSRWSVGTAGAYAPTLQEHIEGFHSDILVPLRNIAPDAIVTWLEGNHDLRIKDFVTKYAPALRVLDALKMENLFHLDDLGIKYTSGPLRIGTNTVAVHGHESSGYSSTPQAWQKKFTERYGSERNFIFGHTHQPFLMTHATGYDGRVSPWFTMNVGSIMDPTHATYVKDGAVSWTMSFAVIHDDGKRVWPELVLANNRQFIYQGEKF